MLKKSIASIVSAALLVTGPAGAAQAAGNRAPVKANVPAGPHNNLRAIPSVDLARPGSLTAVAPAAGLTADRLGAAPVATREAQAAQAAAADMVQALTAAAQNGAAAEQSGAVLNTRYDGLKADEGTGIIEVSGDVTSRGTVLPAATRSAARAQARVPVQAQAAEQGGSMTLGVIAVVAAVIAIIPRSRALAKRAILGAYDYVMSFFPKSPQEQAKQIMAEIESYHAGFNAQVMEAKRIKSVAEGRLATQRAERDRLSALMDSKLKAQSAHKEGTPGFDALELEVREAGREFEAVKTAIGSTESDIQLAVAAEKKAVEDRRLYLNVRSERMSKLMSGLNQADIGDLNLKLAELKKKGIIDTEAQLDKFNAAVDKKAADGKGAQDAVDSDPTMQRKQADGRITEGKVDDELAKRRAAMKAAQDDKTKTGGEMKLDLRASHFKVVGRLAGALFAIAMPWYAAAAAVALGLIALIMPADVKQEAGKNLFFVGAATAAIGGAMVFLGKATGFVVMGATGLVWIAPALVLMGLGLYAAVDGYMKKEKAAAAAAQASAPAAPVEAPRVVHAPQPTPVMQDVPKAEPVKDTAVPSVPAGPSVGDMANRAGAAIKDIGSAAATGAAAAATQASAAARSLADKGVSLLEQTAKSAGDAAGAASAAPAAQAPSAAEIAARLRDASLKLADAGVTSIEQRIDPNNEKPAPGLFNLFKRMWNVALKALDIGFGHLEVAMDKLETPEMLANRMQREMAAAVEAQQRSVLKASQAYAAVEVLIDRKTKESREASTKVDQLLKRNNEQDTAAAAFFMADKILADGEIEAAMLELAKARAIKQKAIAMRALVMAQKAEVMSKVRMGLSTSNLATIQAQLNAQALTMQAEMAELDAKFNAKVDALVAQGRGAEAAADSDPAMIKARAMQRAQDAGVADALAQRKAELAAGK